MNAGLRSPTLSSQSPTSTLRSAAGAHAARGPSGSKPPTDAETREKFQEFVAGTFFQQMFKSLRETQQKPKYFHGGQAEEIFQSQLDQQLSTDLAKKHGAALAGPLYEPFVANARARIRRVDAPSDS